MADISELLNAVLGDRAEAMPSPVSPMSVAGVPGLQAPAAPAAAAPVPGGPGLKEMLKLFVPALLVGMEGRRNGFNAALQSAGSMGVGYSNRQNQQDELAQRQQQLDMQNQRIAQDARDHAEMIQQRQAVQQAQAAAAAEQARLRLVASVRTAVDKAAMDPGFIDMVNTVGGEKFTLPVDGKNIPLAEAFDMIGVIRGGDGKYIYGKPEAPTPDPLVTSRTEDAAGNTVEELIPQSQRRAMGKVIVNRPAPKAPKEPKEPKNATVKVRKDVALDEAVVTYTDATGSSEELTMTEVRELLRRTGRASDDITVGKVMRNAAAMSELLSQ